MNSSSAQQFFSKVISSLLVLGLAALGIFAFSHIRSDDGRSGEPNDVSLGEQSEVSADSETLVETVVLSPGKLEAGRFESLTATSQTIQHSHTVPGRIRYDESKHVDVRAPMDGMLSDILVTPGEHVESGTLLAVVRSPEIGQARAEVLKHQQQLEISRQVLVRETTLSKNLTHLSAMLRQYASIDSIENEFANQSLGGYQEELLSSYAKVLLSTELLEKTRPLVSSGSISGRAFREREADRQITEAAFRSSLDQAIFAAKQAKAEAQAKVAEAERQLNLAWQSVETMLGHKQDKSAVNLSDEEALSRLEVRAPFSGTVEAREFASSERVARGETLIVLANTDTLYVAASIRESDWSAVSLDPGTTVSVTVPALDNRVFDATLHYVGREVSAETNSIPLVAKLRNDEGRLRPGMFVRVSVPIGEARHALSVKPNSVVQHENQKFVFLDLSGGRFRRVDVSTGLASEEWVEVTGGLSAGQPVVTSGAFLLKSELLLQGEDE